MRKSLFLSFVVAVMIVAGALRLARLSQRPLHTDEAVHADKYSRMLERGSYKYDPYEYHGPTLNYLTVILVDTIIMMARNLGLEVIAEGVETEQELVYLHRKGCLVYQGYYFSKPVEEEQFVEILRAGQIESAKPVPAEVSAN